MRYWEEWTSHQIRNSRTPTIFVKKYFCFLFQIHDGDNNNALDGLELLQAAMHQDDHFKKIDRDNFIQKANDELNHIIGM